MHVDMDRVQHSTVPQNLRPSIVLAATAASGPLWKLEPGQREQHGWDKRERGRREQQQRAQAPAEMVAGDADQGPDLWYQYNEMRLAVQCTVQDIGMQRDALA